MPSQPVERRALLPWLDAHTSVGGSVGLRVGFCVYTISVLINLAAGGQLSRDPGPTDLVTFMVASLLVAGVAALLFALLFAGIGLATWASRSDGFHGTLLTAASAALVAFIVDRVPRASTGGWVTVEAIAAPVVTALIVVVILRRRPLEAVEAAAGTRRGGTAKTLRSFPVWLSVALFGFAASPLAWDSISEDTPAAVADRQIEKVLASRATGGLDISCPKTSWEVGEEFTCRAETGAFGTIDYLVKVVEDKGVSVIESTAGHAAERIIASDVAAQIGAALDPTCDPTLGWEPYSRFDCVASRPGEQPVDFVARVTEGFYVEVKEARIVDQAEIDEMIDGVIARLAERRGIEIARETFVCDPPPIKVAFGRRLHCDVIDPESGEDVHVDLRVPEIEGDGATIEVDPLHPKPTPSGEPDD